MDKLKGFLPDADPTTPGAILACTNLIPYENGMQGAPSGQTPLSVPALAATCVGAAVVSKLDASRRILAGTATALYELSGGAWVDRTRVGAYTGGADARWSIAQFGDATLCANLSDVIQRSTGGAFADLATAPKAKIIFSVGSFVLALNTSDATYGVSPDRWWCSASFDDTSWTPSVTTLATTGRLVSSPGPILAGGRLGEYAVVYKEKSIYIGQMVGAPNVWDWLQVPGGEAGCVGQEAWCDIGGAHFIAGPDNFWIFDGSRPLPIGEGQIRQWWYNNSNPSYRYKTKCVFDRQNNLVWVFYCSLGATSPDKALVYHVISKQWGLVDVGIEAVLDYISAGITIDGLASVSATIDGLSAYSFDSQFWLTGGRSLSVFNSAHQLQSLTGPSASSALTTWDNGDDERYSLLSKIRVRFAPGYAPTSAAVEVFGKATEGDGLTAGATGTLADGKFDVLQSARWHRASLAFVGPVRVIGFGATLTPQGIA
jgi:hypothetical protein